MKKLLVFIIILLLIGGAVYIFIPAKITLQKNTEVVVNTIAFNRIFPDEKQWHKWWPGKEETSAQKQGFKLNGNRYFIREKRLTSLLIDIDSGGEIIFSELFFFPTENNSMNLTWGAQSVTSSNPLARIKRLFTKKNLDKDIEMILEKIKSFYQTEANLYGMAINKTFVTDSTLIATSSSIHGYPSTEFIYSLIEKLQAFAAKNGARQTGLPMLNIHTSDSTNFRIQVALPVDKKLKDEGDIVYKWMLGGGNILVTEVKGGPHTINNAFKEIENYVGDFRRTAPAIPFQSLVTDRKREPDTNKWVTKVYWPVM